jgi:hypothetical protein
MPKQVIVTREGFQDKAHELAGLAWDAGESKIYMEVKDGQGFKEGKAFLTTGLRFREKRKDKGEFF